MSSYDAVFAKNVVQTQKKKGIMLSTLRLFTKLNPNNKIWNQNVQKGSLIRHTIAWKTCEAWWCNTRTAAQVQHPQPARRKQDVRQVFVGHVGKGCCGYAQLLQQCKAQRGIWATPHCFMQRSHIQHPEGLMRRTYRCCNVKIMHRHTDPLNINVLNVIFWFQIWKKKKNDCKRVDCVVVVGYSLAGLPFLGAQYSSKLMIYIFSSFPCTKIAADKYK